MKNGIKTFLWLGIFIITSVIGKVVYQEFAKPHVRSLASSKMDNLDTEYKHYSYSTSYQKDGLKVQTIDKATNQKHDYVVTFDNRAKDFRQNANKVYLKQNAELVSQAAKAYGFIISNDYKTVKYCSQYHPVNNFKKKFDLRFQTKKQKAITILNTAFGKDGAKEFEKTILQQSNTLQVFHKQVEDDYLGVKKLAAQDGELNFSREQYCKMLDETADFAVDEEYKKFKLLVPNF